MGPRYGRSVFRPSITKAKRPLSRSKKCHHHKHQEFRIDKRAYLYNICSIKMNTRDAQLEMKLPTWGGKRLGAGRKRLNPRLHVAHHTRPKLTHHVPVHVTLRMRKHVWNMRSRRCFRIIERSFIAGCQQFGFRLVHFSTQRNHFHLVCEADNKRALSRGIQGLAIRIAKGLNKLMLRAGSVFADRYHQHLLRTPSEVRHALNYVANNARHHGHPIDGLGDPFTSSAALVVAQSWLLKRAMPGRLRQNMRVLTSGAG